MLRRLLPLSAVVVSFCRSTRAGAAVLYAMQKGQATPASAPEPKSAPNPARPVDAAPPAAAARGGFQSLSAEEQVAVRAKQAEAKRRKKAAAEEKKRRKKAAGKATAPAEPEPAPPPAVRGATSGGSPAATAAAPADSQDHGGASLALMGYVARGRGGARLRRGAARGAPWGATPALLL